MAHAKPDDLKDLKQLLAELRSNKTMKEKSFGCFYLKGKGVLHFHMKKDRRYAHIYNGKEWIELDISSGPSIAAQKTIAKKILNQLPLS